MSGKSSTAADKLYELGLHGKMLIDEYTGVMRVPGGWIYESLFEYEGQWQYQTTFIPFNNEHQKGGEDERKIEL